MPSALQVDHAQVTRHRIITACTELLANGNPAALSVPAIAERAGVSVRTVYRYFPTKEGLVAAASEQTAEPVRALIGQPITADNYREALRTSWEVLAQNRSVLIAAQRTPEGVATRRERSRSRRRELKEVVAGLGIELDPERERKLVDLVSLVTGSMALFELTDTLGHDLEEATTMAVWILEALIAHARRTGGDGL